ncbi:potassium channel family protein [Bacillus taeanensis]|uniref:Potassium channel protein n=1 Tax=Bacillus taeanensis TaxID=273032 RepID=A0A366Y564_9BACI|nr:potassium channel protein [Bacillus taeanensis]RBW71351.1 potassium channel protein [Bacillus taeanensis]
MLYFKKGFPSYFRFPVLVQLMFIISFIIIISGIAIYFIEPSTFPTIFDGIWWALVTASTVGYGDLVPESTKGRMLTFVLILLGGGFVTFYMAKLASTAVESQSQFMQGTLAFKKEKHLIIVGWNQRAREIIHHLNQLPTALSVVLIDETVKKHPTTHDIHFIKGNASEDRILELANAKEAAMILITADQHHDEKQADMKSILTLLAVKGINPNIYSIVEVLTSEQINNCRRAGANEIIETTNLASLVMMNSLFSHGISSTLFDILNYLEGNKLHYVRVKEKEPYSLFQEASAALVKKNIILLGIKRGEQLYINPSPSLKIKEGDQYIVISN